MHPFFRDAKNLLLDTLFPIQCLGCHSEGTFLCTSCQTKLQRVNHQVCAQCRKPSAGGVTHLSCRRDILPDGLLSAFEYADPLLDQAIIWGKYKFLPDVYKILGRLLAQYLEQNNYQQLIADPLLCPIPLSKQRLRWRGFNQSAIIAGVLCNHFSWPVTDLLSRIKNTKTQKDLTKVQRLQNVSQSFALIDKSVIEGQNIILVDDVITTGATLLEAAKLLKTSGASQVWCLTLARD